MKKSTLIFAIFLPLTVCYAQDQLTFEPDRNVPPSQQYKERDPSNDVQSEIVEETTSQRNKRIKDRYGDSEPAIVLIEDAEINRGQLLASLVRDKLDQAEDELSKVKSRGISSKKKKQLADAWGRLAKSERFLFGDTTNNLEWLRAAYDLNPDNEDVARALDVAERKDEYAQRRLEEAAKIRAARKQQN